MTSIILLGQLVVDPLVWQVPLYGLALIAGIAFVYLIRIHIAVKMAEKRNRSTVGWGYSRSLSRLYGLGYSSPSSANMFLPTIRKN